MRIRRIRYIVDSGYPDGKDTVTKCGSCGREFIARTGFWDLDECPIGSGRYCKHCGNHRYAVQEHIQALESLGYEVKLRRLVCEA